MTILIIFVVIATFAVLGGVLLTVRTVEIKFTNELVYFKDEGTAELAGRLKKKADPLMIGKNGLFSINRNKVTDALQAAENRVHITNIEYKFPSTYVISVRERYPVYKLGIGVNKTAVLCGYLRVLATINEPVEDVKEVPGTEWELIDITNQVRMNVNDLKVTDELTELGRDNSFIKILKELTPFFATTDTKEDALCSIFVSIEFYPLSQQSGGIVLVMRLRPPPDSETAIIDFAVWNAENRLWAKLNKGWAAVEYNGSTDSPGLYHVTERTGAPDGIAVDFQSGGVWKNFLDEEDT